MFLSPKRNGHQSHETRLGIGPCNWQVDDLADRAILNQIADMVVDLAAPVPPSTAASPAASGDVSVEGGGMTLPQSGADQNLLVGGEDVPESTPVGKSDSVPEKLTPPARAVDDNSEDGAHVSDTEDSSSPGISLKETDDKPEEPGGDLASGDNRSECSEKAMSGGKVEDIR